MRSLDRALEFYRDQLGLEVSAARNRGARKSERRDAAAWASRASSCWSPPKPDSVIGKFLDKRGEGLHHVALNVPDLNASVERLRASGARLLNEPRTGAGGHLYVFVHPSSTGGVLLELIQE